MASEKQRKLDADLIKRSQQLVYKISHGCQSERGFGGFSLSLYDTSWVSMVRKTDSAGVRQWAFPEAFAYVLRQQHESPGTNSSPVDVILNTMASLLSLLEHRATDAAEGSVNIQPMDYEWRVSHAIATLSKALSSWNVGSSLHVGFEILIPSLLDQLAQRGVNLDFSGKRELEELQQHKLSKFRPEMVTSKQQSTLLHSLEGLIGRVDFGKLKHHCTVYGGMMGSPASTAAYLIHSPVWDEAAEHYLRNVVQSSGGAPSAFPTSIFETSWSISTLLANGYTIDNFSSDNMKHITTYLQQLFVRQHGLLGFAPTFVPDADDTARSLLALSHLGIKIDPSFMVEYFEAPNHFQTYKLERDPSFSANANILLCLLGAPNPMDFFPQIEKTTRFLITIWGNGGLQDKWNLASEYSQMLLANALLDLIAAWSEGRLTMLSTEVLVRVDISIVLSQLFSKTLLRQCEDGSWGNSVERTAYSVLLLAYILRLPWPLPLRELACASLLRGRNYLTLHANEWSKGDYIWIEKVNYRLPILSEIYCLAAMKVSVEERVWASEVTDIFTMPEKQLGTMPNFLGRLPIFRHTSPDTMLLATAEAWFYLHKLKTIRVDIFPRDNIGMSKDKYLDFIPICWTSVNITTGFPLSGDVIWNMMVISMLNYQADEYMESVVGSLPESSLSELKYEIGVACSESCYEQTHSPHLSEVSEVILKYIRHIRDHQYVAACPEYAQREVAEELEKFLNAHMAHNADNKNNGTTNFDKGKSYFDWVRTTGANDTSCPYSFSFFTCLISRGMSSAKQRYFARALGLHLATMCRQYNDLGSYSRDKQENNLNSLDFTDFHDGNTCETCECSGPPRKQDLIDIAEFERTCMQACFAHLSSEISVTTSAQIKAFINVTDLFGQIYVAKDIASRLKK
ncbi:uncharacterized protein TRUGW13939_10607 [Talaromyces rugulosus]|uniref:Ent-kaurene synthase n=1 Tax=Talaromyces rugulosus TaxID=121627 RepID=A0A7H8RBE7_TALRU|nr:uncharacterized protein TRUGW13939_10607 [Talaromyces rugulosus]QKX63437.1 hypothetical protein TRUGW13939_10607 [Talaromyces rugulosus]